MRIILIRFFTYSNVPALNNSVKEYSDKVCIAYKENLSAPVYVLTTHPEVVDYLYETNPNCIEIRNTNRFELTGFILTNTECIKSHLQSIPGN